MKTFFGAFAGALTGILLLVLIGGLFATCATSRKAKIEDDSFLVIEMYGPLLEYDPPGGIMSQLTGETETLQRILSNLEKARVDDRIRGVVFKVSEGNTAGYAMLEEIRGAIRKIQAAGKPVYGYAESFAEQESFLLAACDQIMAPPTAYVNFDGFAATSLHVKQALEKLGIKPNLHKIKDYKSAAELVTRADMSEPARENSEWMMDERWRTFTRVLADDRGLEERQVLDLMRLGTLSAQEALDGGLLDRLSYWDELEAELKGEDEDELHTVSQSRYAQVKPSKLDLDGDKTVAVIHAQGTIAGRTSGVNPLLGVTMGHESIRAELRRAREDEDVAAIVLRVDSPGGDALSSDLMGHEVEITTAVKPVVVSMVDVAASGGYHISYRASKILADASTLTGSIGSISGKFNIKGLYDKLGITFDQLTRGPNALMFSDLQDFTPEQRARFEENHWASFNDWLRDVAEHRGMSFEQAELLAHGRVWTGRQALENGLVDELGGLDDAVDRAKQLAGIPEDEQVTVEHLPKKKSLLQSLSGGNDAAAAARWLVYRFIRDDVAETWQVIRRDPELAVQLLAP